MVHNGIEYGDMQLIAEAYHLMREGLVQNMFPNLTPAERDIIISANPPHHHTTGISYYLCAECWETTMQEAGEDDEATEG
jgi:6-phosphogluconate dehydrogenase (decarboxylating)